LLESVPSEEENRRTDRTDDGGRVGQVLMFHASATKTRWPAEGSFGQRSGRAAR
jgi:hypothetical protein